MQGEADRSVGLGRYYRIVWARAWRATVAFLKAQIITSLAVTVQAAVVTGTVSTDIGEQFNPRVAVYAALLAAVAIAFVVLACNVVITPWRMHTEQADRLREFERRPDVGRLIRLREHGVQLLNHRVQSDQELKALEAKLRAWEEETAAELQRCATQSAVSAFRVLGSMAAWAFSDAFNQEHNHEKNMLDERLRRLDVILDRVERGAM
jgi:hypothetical protein